ncbi:ATP-dependent endonuclease [Thalassospira xiamenensis]|nr:ATP-dependent endonuclease [Thalassospira xiamenensis]
MYLSRIKIENFRNFSKLDVELGGNIVVVGENRVGKSNLIHALRLIFDPTLPDSSRQLKRSDFWDGAHPLGTKDKISISVDIRDFEEDLDILAILTDFRLDDDPNTVRLNFEFRPKEDLPADPTSEEDYEFLCFGGQNTSKRYGHDIRRRIPIDVLPALRDAEGDLATWRRSPLRPLIEEAFSKVADADLASIKSAVEEATEELGEFEPISSLEEKLASLYETMSGPKQNINPRLGFAETEVSRLYRSIRLMIDDGERAIGDASLGSANIVFLTLKALELEHLMGSNQRDHTLLAIEEPEAHLHPHLQRSVYRHFFDRQEVELPLTVLLTTHSPHIASVAPLKSIVLLRETASSGTSGHSTASIDFTDDEAEDISRYLDVTRAEMLFARGVILVEGDAEKFLLPTFSASLGVSLDKLGITVCSVAGTNFKPYVKLLIALGVPFSIITDWDPRDGTKVPLGINRSINLVKEILTPLLGAVPTEVVSQLQDLAKKNVDEFDQECRKYGIFMSDHTLEVDLFNDSDFSDLIIETLHENGFSAAKTALIDSWKDSSEDLETKKYLSLIEEIGKGRFAQRLASRVEGIIPPNYIEGAIKFVKKSV